MSSTTDCPLFQEEPGQECDVTLTACVDLDSINATLTSPHSYETTESPGLEMSWSDTADKGEVADIVADEVAPPLQLVCGTDNSIGEAASNNVPSSLNIRNQSPDNSSPSFLVTTSPTALVPPFASPLVPPPHKIAPVSLHEASLQALLTADPQLSPVISSSSKTVASSTSSCQ